MIRILLCCGGGFSSSAIATRMKKEIKEQALKIAKQKTSKLTWETKEDFLETFSFKEITEEEEKVLIKLDIAEAGNSNIISNLIDSKDWEDEDLDEEDDN